MIDLIDYGGGNTGSAARAFSRLGADFRFVREAAEITGDNGIVLPGVGSFGAVMKGVAPIRERLLGAIRSGTPFLGICVGLQILFSGSAESPAAPGLGVMEGEVVRFERGKIPQIGWNRVEPLQEGYEAGYAYFVNSYYAAPEDSSVVLYEADYHGPFCAAVKRDNVTAYQFHPEKSGEFGHALLGRWTDAL